MTVDHHKLLYQALEGRGAKPIEPTDAAYVEILERDPERDPILMLQRAIEWARSESVHLLTGFRGNGKSTQLLRLRRRLEASGATVFLVDLNRHMLMTKPVEVSDFLLSLMAGLAHAVRSDTALQPLARSYLERLVNFLKSNVELKDIEIGVEWEGASAKLGAQLQTDVTFKEKVQARMRGHVTRLVEDARSFVGSLVDHVRKHSGDPDRRVVLLVDSFEQLRGIGEEAHKVYASAVELFGNQAVNLEFPKLHVVYSIPPYLVALAPNLSSRFDGGAMAVWPNIHVRDQAGKPDEAGLAIMEQIIAKRYESWEKVLGKKVLATAAAQTGGDIRDFFRVLRDGVLTTSAARTKDPKARFDEGILRQALQRLRNDCGILADDDARWLVRIHATKDVSLLSQDAWPTLARFFDSNILMNYQNGKPWYDVHPVLVPDIQAVAKTAPPKS